MTITKNNLTLIAQATGQSSFPLEAESKNMFVFNQADIKLEFLPNTKQMILTQGGEKFTFTKKK